MINLLKSGFVGGNRPDRAGIANRPMDVVAGPQRLVGTIAQGHQQVTLAHDLADRPRPMLGERNAVPSCDFHEDARDPLRRSHPGRRGRDRTDALPQGSGQGRTGRVARTNEQHPASRQRRRDHLVHHFSALKVQVLTAAIALGTGLTDEPARLRTAR